MKAIKILVILQGIALLFLLFPFEGTNFFFKYIWKIDSVGAIKIQPFPFATITDGGIYLQTYVWMICSEHINWIIMYGVILHLISPAYKPAVFLFGCMEFVYFIEFLLNYNKNWFTLPLVGPVGMTFLFIILKGLILFTLCKQQRH